MKENNKEKKTIFLESDGDCCALCVYCKDIVRDGQLQPICILDRQDVNLEDCCINYSFYRKYH